MHAVHSFDTAHFRPAYLSISAFVLIALCWSAREYESITGILHLNRAIMTDEQVCTHGKDVRNLYIFAALETLPHALLGAHDETKKQSLQCVLRPLRHLLVRGNRHTAAVLGF